MAFDRRFVDVLILGFSFMLVFTAFQSCGMVQTLVLESVHKADLLKNGTSSGMSSESGYYSLAIIYAVFTVCNFFAPPIIGALGPKISMMFGALGYVLFMASFLYPLAWLLYLCSVIVGFCAAVIWTAQGNYLALCSDEKTNGRNSGVLWALLQCSFLFGSIFIYFEFTGKETIDARTRNTVYGSFTGLAILGTGLMLALRNSATLRAEAAERSLASKKNDDVSALNPSEVAITTGRPEWMQNFVKSFKLLVTKEMLLLAVAFFFTGFELTFFSGVYGTMLGRTEHFGSIAKALTGINGIFIGVGEILGGLLFGILGERTIRYSRNPIVFLGFLSHILVFFLILLNMPDDSPIRATAGLGYIVPNVYLAIFCSFLLGFADSCWNTQVYSIICSVYPSESAPAFALFKFFQSLAAALGFSYSASILLHWQLLILVVFDVLGAVCFFQVEWWVLSARESVAEGYLHF